MFTRPGCQSVPDSYQTINRKICKCGTDVRQLINTVLFSGVPRNFVRRGGSTNSVEDRGQTERGSGSGSPLVRGSGGSCSLVQEISFHIVKVS